MPIPNRHYVNEEPYRYAFQGQEKDPETGKEAFQLRLWDGRIGRWLTTDPAGQYHSLYMGMGNNPMNGIDPDGGCFDENGNPCNYGAGIGSTTTGYGGYEYTMTNTGWARSDGYEARVGNNWDNGLNGRDFINGAILLYSISEGASGSNKDFDSITNALKNNTFLSREFNQAGELRTYKLNPGGTAKYQGGGRGNYKSKDITNTTKFLIWLLI